MKMEIGQKKILSNIPPYGMFGHNTKLPLFIDIEIVEQKEDVPGEFSQKTEGHIGYIAKGSDGYQYSYNYPSYYEGYSEPCWRRYITNEDWDKLTVLEKEKLVEDDLWIDVSAFQCPAKPQFPDHISTEILFCEHHQRLYYPGEKCFYCEHNFDPDPEHRVKMNTQEHRWVGWYK